jgi:aryl carrier-like protein
MVPATVTALEALPLTTNGKLDRARLPVPGSQPAGPAADVPAVEAVEAVEAAGDLCAVVRRVWAGLTGLPAQPDDNLFDVGGNSIVIGRLVKELDSIGLPRLQLRQIYQAQTPRQIAALLEAAQQAAITPA